MTQNMCGNTVGPRRHQWTAELYASTRCPGAKRIAKLRDGMPKRRLLVTLRIRAYITLSDNNDNHDSNNSQIDKFQNPQP